MAATDQMAPTDRMAPPGGESGLIVLVPAAEPALAARRPFDPDAGLDVPAHVTVLYPFVPPDHLTEDDVTGVAEAVAGVPAFDLTLTEVQWFGDVVVWLAPEPAAPFVSLTEALARRFPDHPPYGGAYDEITPHLTVLTNAEPEQLRWMADHVAPALPIRDRVTEVVLIARTGTDPFTVRHRFSLGSA